MLSDKMPCEKNVIAEITLPHNKKEMEVICSTGVDFFERGTLAGRKCVPFIKLIDEQVEKVKNHPAKGRVPKIFGACDRPLPRYESFYDLHSALGMNAEYYQVSPQLYTKENAKQKGTFTGTGFWSSQIQNKHLSGKCYRGDFTDYEKLLKKKYARLVRDKVGYLKQTIKIIEETGPLPLEKLRAIPEVNEAFRKYASAKGVDPKKLLPRDKLAALPEKDKQRDGLWKHVVLGLGTPAEAKECPELFYNSMKFRSWLFTELCRRATLEIQKVFPAGTLTNSGSIYPSCGGVPVLERGVNIFDIFKRRGVNSYCSEISWGRGGKPDFIGPQTLSYEGTLARALSKYQNYPLGSFVVVGAVRGYDPQFVFLGACALISQGVEYLFYYELSPYNTSAFFHPEVLKTLKEVNFLTGAVEKDLTGVKAKVAKAETAIGWSSTTDVWDMTIEPENKLLPGNGIYPQERQQLYYMLRHCHVPVDILGEEDLADGGLKGYKVYFLVGDHLSRKSRYGAGKMGQGRGNRHFRGRWRAQRRV